MSRNNTCRQCVYSSPFIDNDGFIRPEVCMCSRLYGMRDMNATGCEFFSNKRIKGYCKNCRYRSTVFHDCGLHSMGFRGEEDYCSDFEGKEKK